MTIIPQTTPLYAVTEDGKLGLITGWYNSGATDEVRLYPLVALLGLDTVQFGAATDNDNVRTLHATYEAAKAAQALGEQS